MFTADDVQAFLSGKGKGNRKGSGKGFGRRKNPKDRNGQIMTCRICGSDEHFQANCPQKGAGRGNSSPPSLFTGATFTPERHTDNEAEPWDRQFLGGTSGEAIGLNHSTTRNLNDNATFTSFRHMFASFGSETPGTDRDDDGNESQSSDPWTRGRDPWSQGRQGLGYGPSRSRRTASGSRVADDDELSGTEESPAPRRPAVTAQDAAQFLWRNWQPQAPAPVPPMPTYSQAYQPILGEMYEPPMAQPYPSVTLQSVERGLFDIHQANRINAQRGTDDRRSRRVMPMPAFMQRDLPITSLNVAGAQRPTTFVPPQQALPKASTLQQIWEAQQFREQARRRHQESGAPDSGNAAAADSGSHRAEATSPAAASSSGQPMSVNPFRPQDPDPEDLLLPNGRTMVMPGPDDYVIWDGNETMCSICTEEFTAGERVCRLQCRHMFHAACWERFVEAINRAPAPSRQPVRADCPNCRGSANLVAVWNYVDLGVATQQRPDGSLVANDLEGSANVFNIGTPRSASDIEAPHGSPLRRPNGMPQSFGPHMFVDDMQDSGSHRAEAAASGSHRAEAGDPAYHIRTRLADGRPGLVIDPGSVGNLCGDEWARTVAKAADEHGYHPSFEKRPRPLNVSGVGNGAQVCKYDCKLPVALQKSDGKTVQIAEITTPTVTNSDLPGLLGLAALRKNRAVLDFQKNELHFLGPGDYDLERTLPPGTDTFALEVAPSGHLVLPCSEFVTGSRPEQYTMTLLTEPNIQVRVPSQVPPPPPAPPTLPPAAHL